MELDEIISSPAFWVLNLVGYGAFIMMLMVLKGMGETALMPLWVKVIVMIVIPIVSAVFSIYAES